jgi:hypothetical protein
MASEKVCHKEGQDASQKSLFGLDPVFFKSRNAAILINRGNAILIPGKCCSWKVQTGKRHARDPARVFCPYHLS